MQLLNPRDFSGGFSHADACGACHNAVAIRDARWDPILVKDKQSGSTTLLVGERHTLARPRLQAVVRRGSNLQHRLSRRVQKQQTRAPVTRSEHRQRMPGFVVQFEHRCLGSAKLSFRGQGGRSEEQGGERKQRLLRPPIRSFKASNACRKSAYRQFVHESSSRPGGTENHFSRFLERRSGDFLQERFA
jgi:hypothetical protein